MPLHRQEYEELLKNYQNQVQKHYSRDEDEHRFLSFEGGPEWSEFSYFPRMHYRKAIEGYQELLNGEVFDELTDELAKSLESQLEPVHD